MAMRRGTCSSQRDDKAPARPTDVLAPGDTTSDCGTGEFGQALVAEQRTEGAEVQLPRYRSAFLLLGTRAC
jgi:hypothetical protein